VGILVTFVPPKVTASRGMSDMPSRGTAADIAHSGSANAKTRSATHPPLRIPQGCLAE